MASIYTRPIGEGTVNFAINISRTAKELTRSIFPRLGFKSENAMWQEMFLRGIGVDHPEIAQELRIRMQERKSITPEMDRIVSRHLTRVGGSAAILVAMGLIALFGSDHSFCKARRGRSMARVTVSRNAGRVCRVRDMAG